MYPDEGSGCGAGDLSEFPVAVFAGGLVGHATTLASNQLGMGLGGKFWYGPGAVPQIRTRLPGFPGFSIQVIRLP